MRHNIFSGPILGMSLLLATQARAEWSSDPSKNTAIADVVGINQVQPKISPLADKSWYVSWFTRNPHESVPHALTLNLQRLHQNGAEIFPHNGIQIAKMSLHSSGGFALDTDASGNALLAFIDSRNEDTSSRISITKISPSGQALWEDSGVSFTTRTRGRPPKIAVTSDGGVVLAWTTDDHIVLQKLDAEGHSLWTRRTASELGVVLNGESHISYELVDICASEDGAIIVSFVRAGRYTRGAKHLYTNKIAADGRILWGKDHVKIFDVGSLDGSDHSAQTEPSVISDGKGGAIFAWFSQNPRLQVYVQHIRADGSEAFPHNGVVASTNAQQWRDEPTLSYRAATGEIFLFWSESVFADSQQKRGVYAQKFSADGTRQWTDHGRAIAAAGSSFQTSISSIQASDGVFVFWIDAPKRFEKSTIQGIKLDWRGKELCSQFSVSSSSSRKSDLAVDIDLSGRQLLLAWKDDRSNVGYDEIQLENVNDVYIQNVNLNCSLGVDGR